MIPALSTCNRGSTSMSKPPPDKDRLHLFPLMREKAEALDEELARRNLPFYLWEGFRGKLRQLDGLDNRTSLASFLQSKHNYGCAVDYVGRQDVTGLNPWDLKLPWKEYGACVKAVGLSWSGEWAKFPELVHADLSNVYSNLQLRSAEFLLPLTVERLDWLEWWIGEVVGTSVLVAIQQRLLTVMGYKPGVVDGIFGQKTIAATAEFLSKVSPVIPAKPSDLAGLPIVRTLAKHARDAL